jgi:hypothetical protein
LEPDELLVDLIGEATEKICGYKPDSTQIECFISKIINQNVYMPSIDSKPLKNKITQKRPPITVPSVTEAYAGKYISSFIFRGERYEVKYWIDVLTKNVVLCIASTLVALIRYYNCKVEKALFY